MTIASQTSLAALAQAVTMTYQQMRAARGEGAPWPMVRFYMRAEFRHALHAHPGYAQDCAPLLHRDQSQEARWLT